MRTTLVLASAVLSSSVAAQGFGPGLFPSFQLLVGEVSLQPIHAADMDADGRPDLLTCDYLNGGCRIFLQQPDGTFAPGQKTTLLSLFALAIPRPVDLDADGLPDVVSPGSSEVVVRMGIGGGQLGPQLGSVAPSKMIGEVLQVADFSGDGLPDALAGAPSFQDSGQIFGAKGLGDGTFDGWGLLASTRRPEQSEVGDFDLDGDVDALFVLEGNDAPAAQPGLLLMRNPGNGVLEEAPWTMNVEYTTRLSRPADLDADGSPDLVLFDTYDGRVQALLGADDATFELLDVTTFSWTPNDVAAADLDADGYPDLVATTDTYPSSLRVQRLVRLLPAGPLDLYEAYAQTDRVLAADLDADGLQDVVVSAFYTLVVLHDALGPFIDVGKGSLGGPVLTASGQPSPGQAVTVSLQPAGAPTSGMLLLGLSVANLPTAAGLLVPAPVLGIPVAVPSKLPLVWPPGLPVGTLVYLQGAAQDPAWHLGNAVVVVPEP